MFKMEGHESIDEMTIRFMHIINKLKALDKTYINVMMVRKILRSLFPDMETQSHKHSRGQRSQYLGFGHSHFFT